MDSIAFGPVPSRRLGQSLGINNVPPKSCSYSCVYCQVGPTAEPEMELREFFSPGEVISAVSRQVQALRQRGETIDFLTFVPDGEPTLDRHLGEEIDGLAPLEIPIAVISNSSLTWREDVRATVGKADWVSFKVDAIDNDMWRRINRPHQSLDIEMVLEGIVRFSEEFNGELVTETMLVRDVNDTDEAAEALVEFLARVQPQTAYVAVPTRPPSERWVRPATEDAVNRVFQCFAERLPRVELLTGYEGQAFGTTGNAVEDLLAITAVHPLRQDAAIALLTRDGADRAVLESLLEDGRVRVAEYQGRNFYIRRFPAPEEQEGELS